MTKQDLDNPDNSTDIETSTGIKPNADITGNAGIKTSSDIKKSIDIKVRTQYLAEQSDPEDGHYVFAYVIDIRNNGDLPVTLLNRRWRITDEDNHVDEVTGKGVVGLQPKIDPGQVFHYSSGAVLATAIGTMEGSYEMVDSSGRHFDAPVPAFLLSRPLAVH